MTRHLIALSLLVTLAACTGTPERGALDEFNDTVGTANRTASNIRMLDRLLN
ncbi:hypothetical protein [Paracoccus sediminicola]|uniref:hypothetical protein n=1 Tax=Paracoccus sediminicola TaxID=3017783 RepID=UPI0022F09686|nr:hypothetical protein [Paracoccus sediminicola]WBU56717.1 hypothetical protein PAF18_14785 [Paracoccus sediminicola]